MYTEYKFVAAESQLVYQYERNSSDVMVVALIRIDIVGPTVLPYLTSSSQSLASPSFRPRRINISRS